MANFVKRAVSWLDTSLGEVWSRSTENSTKFKPYCSKVCELFGHKFHQSSGRTQLTRTFIHKNSPPAQRDGVSGARPGVDVQRKFVRILSGRTFFCFSLTQRVPHAAGVKKHKTTHIENERMHVFGMTEHERNALHARATHCSSRTAWRVWHAVSCGSARRRYILMAFVYSTAKLQLGTRSVSTVCTAASQKSQVYSSVVHQKQRKEPKKGRAKKNERMHAAGLKPWSPDSASLLKQ